MWSSYGRQQRRIHHTLATHTPPPPPPSIRRLFFSFSFFLSFFLCFLCLFVCLFVCRLAYREARSDFIRNFWAVNKQDTQTSSTKGTEFYNNECMNEWRSEWMNDGFLFYVFTLRIGSAAIRLVETTTLSQSNRCWWAKPREVSRLFISEIFF